MEKVFAVFNKLFEMSEETRKMIEMFTEEIIVQKNDILVRKGRSSRYVYFIVEGLLQIVSESGVITWILTEGDFVISIGSTFEQLPAKDTIQAGERTVLLRMSYDHLMEICRNDPEFERVVTKLRGSYYDRQHERCEKLGSEPIDRYRWVMDKYPELLTRLHFPILCKYLAITEGKMRKVMKEIREGRGRKKE